MPPPVNTDGSQKYVDDWNRFKKILGYATDAFGYVNSVTAAIAWLTGTNNPAPGPTLDDIKGVIVDPLRRIEAAKPAVLSNLRRLRHQGIVRETQVVLAAYPAFARAEASDEFAVHAAWFTSETNQVISAPQETVRHGSLSDARASAGAYNLVVAVRLMSMRRLGDIIPPLQAPEELVASLMLTALQTNYELAGARTFDADAGGASVDTSGLGELSRRGEYEAEVVRVTRAAMGRMLELGYTRVTDAQRGSGRVTNV